MIRVESEETQDYVCGMLAISRGEAEEFAFVSSALSEPRGSIYFCDSRCSEKAVRYWQFASVVVEEGGEAHTINFVSAMLQRADGAARQAEVESVAMESSFGTESTSWENVQKVICSRSLLSGILEEVRGNVDVGCVTQMVRKGYIAM